MIPAELVGAWALVSVTATSVDDDEQKGLPFGEHPVGQLLYAANGHMAIVLMREGRPRFASGDVLDGMPEEIRQAFEGFEAYAGTYQVDIDDGSILHHALVCRLPNWEGGTQFRFFTLDGNELVLNSPPIKARGQEWVLSSTWRRKA